MAYFQSGEEPEDRAARRDMLDVLQATLRAKHEALSILTGDFNFVTSNTDRWTKSSGEWSGHKDHSEATAFRHHFQAPGAELLMELEQEEFTFDGNAF